MSIINREEQKVSVQLQKATQGSLHDPTLQFLYGEYVNRGILKSTVEILAGIEPVYREPFLHTLGSHVTKEKPLFVHALAGASGLEAPRSNTLSSVIDLLWSLSLMYDDIEDNDELRAGKQSSWKKYGVELTRESIGRGLDRIWQVLEQRFGVDAVRMGQTSVQRGINSLSAHRALTFGNPLGDFYQNYLDRQAFHCDFPVSIIFLNNPDVGEGSASESIRDVNMAGQLTNDVKDMLPDYQWIRPSFSDLRNGIVTIPLKMMWDGLNDKYQSQVQGLLGSGNLTVEEKAFLLECMDLSGARIGVNDRIRSLYSQTRRSFFEVVDLPEDREVMDRWVVYKEKQIGGAN